MSLVNTGKGNDFSLAWCQAIITWINVDLLRTEALGKKSEWNFYQYTKIFIQEHVFENVAYKWKPFCSGLNALIEIIQKLKMIKK